ncbi:MAG TPA: hypothetical protein VG986_10010 [Pseudolabrys sp.]|nr:hypothetical protein [Pseudolabrys sp.]
MDVVLYQENGMWIAQGLQFDITARGKSPTEAAKNFDAKVGAELAMSLELGDESPLAGVGKAPDRFWDMFKDAEMRVETDVVPVRLLDVPNAPKIVPTLRIADKVAA